MFNNLHINVKPNQDFLKFISDRKNKKQFTNIEMIKNMQIDYPDLFAKIIENFDKVKELRETVNQNGKPVKTPWEEALVKFYIQNRYDGVTEDNKEIAEVFNKKGISQEVFNETSKIMKESKENNIPEHILGKELKEETIIESITRLKNQARSELTSAKEILDSLYKKQFTYEWLRKNDPRNAIIGIYCNCCATITNQYYGKKITKATINSPEVQNLVIRDSSGNIISKGSMYVNKDYGYAVINEFELNSNYKKHESESGVYNVENDSKEEQDREMIFKAFQRGIHAFIEEYDSQNPKKPIKQVNIGWGYNRLKKQVGKFEKETFNLRVPSKYGFCDASSTQYILYKREEKDKDDKTVE